MKNNKPEKDHIVLNIEADEEAIKPKKTLKVVSSGNIFVDTYNKLNNYLISLSGVKPKDKATFFHLLSVMINSGIPMLKSLKSLSLQLSGNVVFQSVITSLVEDIQGGKSLSEAMFEFQNVFDDAEIGMIRSGEATGRLASVLENLAKDAEKAYLIKSKVKSAMMYPIVILLLLVAVVVAMMVFVIPKLKDLFDATGGELPTITKVVIAISDFLRINGQELLLGLLVFFVGVFIFKKTDSGKYFFDNLKLKIPIFGKLFKKAFLSRFARSLSNLLDSNVTIVESLEITANSIGNEVYKKRLLMSLEDIKQGIPLAENLTASPLFPPMLVNMVDVGEQTAQLDEISGKIATFYEDEVDTAVSGISKIIEPVILIIIGATVATVVAAIMLPIMELSNLSDAI